MAADNRLSLTAAASGEGERLIVGALHVAVALEPADHLVDGRRGQLHRARDVRAVDLQTGLLEPEHRLQVFLLGNGGLSHDPSLLRRTPPVLEGAAERVEALIPLGAHHLDPSRGLVEWLRAELVVGLPADPRNTEELRP